MNKKTIALIIVLVVIVGGYASYYAYASMVIIPEDLKTFQSELDAASKPFINESQLKEMENQADTIENYNALSLIPQSERDKIAENLTVSESGKAELEEIKQNFTSNRNTASRYDLLFKGDVANNIRLAYDQKIFDIINQMIANLDKQKTDIKNGDSTAWANDLREFVKLARELNTYQEKIKPYLQDIVNKLEG